MGIENTKIFSVETGLDMNKRKFNLLTGTFILILTICGTQSYAQTGNLGDEQINVVKAYQPMLSDAFKISDIPARDTTVTYVPDLIYEIAPEKFPTVYTISPIKPLKIKDDQIKKLYHGFVKGGYGTKNTPYAELFYNSLRSKNMDAGVHLKHLSSSGKIKNFGHPGMSESGIKLFGSRFFDGGKASADLGYNRLAYHYYGFNSPPDIFSKSETKHTFDDLYGGFGLKSNDRDKDRFRYDGNLSFYDISDNKKSDETDIKFDGNFIKPFDEFEVGAGVQFDYARYKNELLGSENRSIVRIDPRFMKTIDRFQITAGANIAIEINDLTKYHLYPHARVDVTLVDETMSVYGQLTGNLERYSYRELAKENPFVGDNIMLNNSNHKLDVSAGMNIKLDKQLAFIGGFSLVRITDDHFYVNYLSDTSSTMVKYDVGYDNNTQTNLHAEIVFDQGDKAGFSVTGDYFGNKTSKEDKALFRPAYRIGMKGFYAIADKIYLNTQLSYTGPRYYLQYLPTGYEYGELKGYFDMNLGADYRYSKVLSVFINFHNLTATKYSRWYNYPSYRFGVLGGVTYSF